MSALVRHGPLVSRIVAAIFPKDNSDLNPKQHAGKKAALPKDEDGDGSPDDASKKPGEENGANAESRRSRSRKVAVPRAEGVGETTDGTPKR